MSNSLDPDQARRIESSGLIWVQTVCQGYQQTTLVDKELMQYELVIYLSFIFMWFMNQEQIKYLRTNGPVNAHLTKPGERNDFDLQYSLTFIY